MEKDLVKIICYNKEQYMERQEAIKFYLECMMCSEGAERDRYVNIYLGLIQGRKEVRDC